MKERQKIDIEKNAYIKKNKKQLKILNNPVW